MHAGNTSPSATSPSLLSDRRASTPLPQVSTTAERLVILFHAYSAGPKSLQFVERTVRRVYGPAADVWIPKLPVGVFSFSDPAKIAQQIAAQIRLACTQKAATGRGYSQITLVGHSIGALIARKAYLCECDSYLDALQGGARDEPISWAPRVDRIVLLAAMNRGWTISPHLSLTTVLKTKVGAFFANAVQLIPARRLVISSVRRGAPFITELRLHSLAVREKLEKAGLQQPLVIQMLGTVDDLVSPEDNIDLVTGSDFVYLDVPNSGHSSIRLMDETTDGQERARILRAALESSRAKLRTLSQLPADQLPQTPNPAVNHVVFVVHGISDVGYWTQRLARKVRQSAEEGAVFATVTSSYGYFPMLPFFLPWRRRRKVEWLMDQYTQAKALYPNAVDNFHFIGHSNGTYLLARALLDYPSAKFNRVVFAGSVVRRHFPWLRLREKGQVQEVLNYVATFDLVVALFPKAFQRLAFFDLGSAGHDGFATESTPDSHVSNIRYVRGMHSAALKENNWSAIAKFIARGDVPSPNLYVANRPSAPLRLFGAVSFLLLVLLGALLVWILCMIGSSDLAQTSKAIAIFAYVVVLWLIVTRL